MTSRVGAAPFYCVLAGADPWRFLSWVFPGPRRAADHRVAVAVTLALSVEALGTRGGHAHAHYGDTPWRVM